MLQWLANPSIKIVRHGCTRHLVASRYFLRQYSSSSSVNPTEVSHFNALASTWWDPYGPSRLLHLMNPLRHDFISTCLNSQSDAPETSNLRYLDVGCGGGIFAESAARLPQVQSVTAIDPSPEVLAVAKAHANQDPSFHENERLRYLESSIEGLPLPKGEDEQFDILTLFEVIEHISDPSPFLQNCLRFVKPGGWIILSTISRTWTSWFVTKLVAEDLARIVPQGTHDWNKYIKEEELQRWFTKEGLTRINSMGVVYLPGLGWKRVDGSENFGNYFFGARKDPVKS